MTHIDKVVWTEGTLLGPQHLQQHDEFYEHQQYLNTQVGQSFQWGFASVELDDSYLPQRQFILKKCRALFRDGRWIDFDGNRDSHLILQIPEDAINDVSVYLILSNDKSVSNISGYPDEGHATGFEGFYTMVADQYDKRREREVLLARPKIKLAWQELALQGHSFLKLAELQFDANLRSYTLSNQYIYPALQLASSPGLNHWLSGFIGHLQRDCETLILQESQKSSVSVQNGLQTRPEYQLRHCIMRHLFQLNAQKQTAMIHPLDVYQTLAGLIGELMAYNMSLDLSFPSYLHDNISATFRCIEKRYADLFSQLKPVEIVTIEWSSSIRFGLVSAKIGQMMIMEKHLCLVVECEDMNLDLISSLSMQLKIAAPSKIESIIHSFTKGIGFKQVHGMEKQAEKMPSKVYFELEKNAPGWEDIVSEQQLAIYFGADLSHINIQLIAY